MSPTRRLQTVATLAILAALPIMADAQIPDVLVKIDVLLHYRTEPKGSTALRAYDALGHYGTVGLSFTLEPGFQVFVAQRLQTIDDNADADQLDQMFIEDRGLWRLGKQLMPFGSNVLLRESIWGARFETPLGTEAIPSVFVACDNGRGKQRGIAGRIGGSIGVSFAAGTHFGIDAASLAVLRGLENPPAVGAGYKEIFGADATQSVGDLKVRIEHARFLRGEGESDVKRDVTDLVFSLEPDPSKSLAVGWTRDWRAGETMLRIQGKLPAAKGTWVEPVLQMQEGKVQSFGVSVRLRF